MTNKTIEDILNDMIPDGLVVDKLTDEPNTAATALLKQFKAIKVDQALKEISELLLDCKPEEKYVSEDEDPAKAYDDLVHEGYNQAIDDYENNIKTIIGGKDV